MNFFSDVLRESANWLRTELEAFGFSVYTQTFLQKNGSLGETVFITVRAPRADGTESFVVGTKFEPLTSEDIKLSALGLTVSLIQALQGLFISSLPTNHSSQPKYG